MLNQEYWEWRESRSPGYDSQHELSDEEDRPLRAMDALITVKRRVIEGWRPANLAHFCRAVELLRLRADGHADDYYNTVIELL